MTYAAGKKFDIIAGKIQSRMGVYLPAAGLFFNPPPPFGWTALVSQDLLIVDVSKSHSIRHTRTLGKTPLNE
jgi:hypothetical protein